MVKPKSYEDLLKEYTSPEPLDAEMEMADSIPSDVSTEIQDEVAALESTIPKTTPVIEKQLASSSPTLVAPINYEALLNEFNSLRAPSLESYRDARQNYNTVANLDSLSRAGAKFVAALNKGNDKPEDYYDDSQLKLAEKNVALSKGEMDLAKDDINSLLSKLRGETDPVKQAYLLEQIEHMKSNRAARAEELKDRREARGLRQENRQQDLKNKVVDAYNKDSNVKKSIERLGMAESAKQLLDINNPVSGEAAKTAIARLSGEVGAMTEADVARFGGSKAIKSRLTQLAKQAYDGKLTDENRKYLYDIIGAYEGSVNKNLDKKADEISNQYSKTLKTDKTILKDIIRPEPDYTQDPRVQKFMEKNNIKDVKEAVKILKDNGKL